MSSPIAKRPLYLSAVLSSILMLCCVSASASAIRMDALTPAQVLPPNDDGSTGRVNLGFELCFFGVRYSSLFVNNNGNVTFNAPLSTFTPSLAAITQPIIAPFFADVDSRGIGSGTVTYGNAMISSDDNPILHQAFIVNWFGVGYFSQHTNKLNTFQLVIDNLGNGDADIEFNYESIQWETGDASGGSNGLGGASALVGYNNGTGFSNVYPGSLVNGAFINGGPNELRSVMLNDENLAGRIEIECRDCQVVNNNVPEPGTIALMGLGIGLGALRRRIRSGH